MDMYFTRTSVALLPPRTLQITVSCACVSAFVRHERIGANRPGLQDCAGKKKGKLRRRLMSVISLARAAAMKAAEKAAGAAVAAEPVERYPVPYTLAVSTVDKLTLELDFCADDIAGGEGLQPMTPIIAQT